MSNKNHFTIIDGVLTKKEKEKDKLRMGGGSWSINLDEINKEPSSIKYITELTTYTISYADARLRGFIRVLGGEKKLIVPIKYWTTDLEIKKDPEDKQDPQTKIDLQEEYINNKIWR